MKYLVDAHTHTLASGHAYNTINEMAEAADDKGLEILGITEHATNMPGTCHPIYFANLKVVDRDISGVEMFFGAELNIIDYAGKVDLEERILKALDLTVASLHGVCIGPGTRENNTAAIINAMKNPFIDIIGHPDDGAFETDYLAIAKAAKEYGTLIELNNSSLSPTSYRANAYNNNIELLGHCKKLGVEIVVNSDAHYSSLVGDFSFAEEVLKEVDYPEELIMNYFPEKFRAKTQKYKKK